MKGKPDIVINKYKKEVEEGEEEQNEEEKNEAEVEETVEELEAKLEKLDKGEDENENKKEEPKEDFTEELKLSYLVRQIEYDTDVVPAGAFKLIPEHELRVNKCFKGLLLKLGGMNQLLMNQPELVIVMSLLQAAMNEYNNPEFEFQTYRKLILDAGAEVDKLKEV